MRNSDRREEGERHDPKRPDLRMRQPRAGDPEFFDSEALEKLEAQSDPLINLVGHVERERANSPAFEDPRFVEWLSNEARAAGGGAAEALGRREITALARQVLERASAERLGVHAARGRARELAHGTPAPVSQLVEESRDAGQTGILDLAAAAGVGRELWDAVVDTCVELPPGLPKARYLALKVAGDSMQPLLHTGDTILVRLGNDVKPDTVVVALVPDSGYVVKRAGRVTRASLELLSLNPEYRPIHIDREEHTVLGTVVLRWCDHRVNSA